jgi:hypothetical protein
VSDKIQWHDNTISHLDEHTGEVLLFNNTSRPAECYFKIDAPQGATWIASLIPVAGHSDAFEFVDPKSESGKGLKSLSGNVGEIGIIKVRVKNATDQTDTNKAKLRIVVKTANDGQTIVVENLCPGHDYNEYTLVQNRI